MATTTTEQDERDRAAMAQLVAGHDAALNALMEHHGQAIYRFLYRLLANEADALDLAQETFVRVYRARHSFRPSGRFSTWLYTIATNLARNHVRWRARHATLSLDDPDKPIDLADAATGPEGTLEARERLIAVRAAVQKLPEDLREAIVLCEWEDLTMTESAEVLNTTAKAVESRLYRARKQLRESLLSWMTN